jgi:hypothetical protein
MYPAHYESWFLNQSQGMHNPSLSPIDINARSLDDSDADSIYPDTPGLFNSDGLAIHLAAQSDNSDHSHTLAFDSDALLKSNTPSDLMRLHAANLIQWHVGTHQWEVECPDCKVWTKTTLPAQILSKLNVLGYFNTLGDHRQGKKCLKD